MNITKEIVNEIPIASVDSNEIVITDSNSALDFMMTIRYNHDCDYIILNKKALSDDFFELSTKIAGDVLQKIVNYGMKVAIIGDYSLYDSKALSDFMFESNKGLYLFFVSTKEDAIEKLIEKS